MALPPFAHSGPITGATTPDADSQTDTSGAATYEAAALFDLSGVPLLQISPPVFLQLDPRDKLRVPGVDPLLADGFSVWVISGGAGSPASGGTSSDPAASTSTGGAAAIGNLSFTAGSDDGTATVDASSLTNNAVPEPSTLLLMTPAVAYAARRWLRSKTRNGVV